MRTRVPILMAVLKLWIERSIFSEIEPRLSAGKLAVQEGGSCIYEPVDKPAQDPSKWIASKASASEIQVFIAKDISFFGGLDSVESELFSLIQSGKIRLAVLGQTAIDQWVQKGICILPESGLGLELGLTHLCRAALPGVQSVLKARDTVFTDRLTHDVEIGRKIDRALSYLEKERKADGDDKFEASMQMRLALSPLLSVGLRDRPTRGSPVVFQMGWGKQFAAFSVRWKIKSKPALEFLSEYGLSAIQWAAGASDFCSVHFMPESNEIEVLVAISCGTKFIDPRPRFPEFVDHLTTLRITTLMRASDAARLRQLGFKTFGSLPDSRIPVTERVSSNPDLGATVSVAGIMNETESGAGGGQSGGGSGDETHFSGDHANEVQALKKSDSSAELKNLKTEFDRLQNTSERFKEQAATFSRKLGEALDEKKKLQNQIRTLEHQLAQAKSGKSDNDSHSKRELESMKKTVESTKARENEMIRKYAASVEENKKLQTEIKALKRKGAA